MSIKDNILVAIQKNGGTIDAPDGKATATLRNLMPDFLGGMSSMSAHLFHLEAAGLIRRELRGYPPRTVKIVLLHEVDSETITQAQQEKDEIVTTQQGVVDQVVAALRANGGAISSARGLATPVLRAKTGFEGGQQLFAAILRRMELDGIIMRETRGRRTFEIVLMDAVPPVVATPAVIDEEDAETEDELVAATETIAQAEHELVEELIAAPPEERAAMVGAPEPVAFEYDKLAASLLRQTMEVLSQPAEIDRIKVNMGKLTDENDRLRKDRTTVAAQLNNAQDEVRAVKGERDRLRTENHRLEEVNAQLMRKNASDIDRASKEAVDTFVERELMGKREPARLGNNGRD